MPRRQGRSCRPGRVSWRGPRCPGRAPFRRCEPPSGSPSRLHLCPRLFVRVCLVGPVLSARLQGAWRMGSGPCGAPRFFPNAVQKRHAVTRATCMITRSNRRALQGLRLPAWRQPRSAQQRFSTALHALLVCCFRGLCFCTRMPWMVWQRAWIVRCMRSYLVRPDAPTPHLSLIRPRTR